MVEERRCIIVVCSFVFVCVWVCVYLKIKLSNEFSGLYFFKIKLVDYKFLYMFRE